MMEVGKKYRNINFSPDSKVGIVECVYIFSSGGKVVVECFDGGVGVVCGDSEWWKEIPEEKWAVLMWGDKQKTTIYVNKYLHPTEEAAIKTWGPHWAFIKAVKIE